MRRLTQEEFLSKCFRLFGDKYDYSKTTYVTRRKNITVRCKNHGYFTQMANDHLSGYGCPKCGLETACIKHRITSLKNKKKFVQPKEYKFVPMANNKYAIVDNEDFEFINSINWRMHSSGYAYSNEGLMHRVIMNNPAGKLIDHINHNKLDNRKSNLRICNVNENIWNSRPSGKFKGVVKSNGKIYSRINCFGKSYYLGTFKSEEEAAKAYDKKAKELFGEFAYLNFKDNKND